MKNSKKIFLVLALGSLMLPLLNSCHKYKEDPFISLRRPQDTLFYNMFFQGHNTLASASGFTVSWDIKELYKSNFHMHTNNVDIYF